MGSFSSDTQNGGRDVAITFEDLSGNGKPAGPLPAAYAGCTWCDSAWFLTKGCNSSACIDGRVALFNANGDDLTVEREGTFHLKSLLLSSLWEEKADVVLEGWRKGAVKYSATLTARKSRATQFDLDYRDIDRVTVRTGGAHVTIDNMVLRLG